MNEKVKKARNLVLCSDGTGNKGGSTPDSNVFKTYNAVDIHDPTTPQITFYDNGVGTSTKKIRKAIGGGIGVGFRTNVCDLYEFLAQNYRPGDENTPADQVFVFGFSRGAATVRGFTGFLNACGLVDGRKLTIKDRKKKVAEAFGVYERGGTMGQQAVAGMTHGVIPLKFVGVWDTVAALGAPQRTDITGLVSFLVDKIFALLDKIIEKLWPHGFYNYELTENIENAYQALSIDDERTSFWPLVWDENKFPGTRVEQVWFAGVHSNVGGGYEREGMANVCLAWMIRRAKDHGLKIKTGELDEIDSNSNAKGLMYDSRSGMGVFYRYHPRNMVLLCADKLRKEIRIHDTVIDRMAHRTENYAPTYIPQKFGIAYTDPHRKEMIVEIDENQADPDAPEYKYADQKSIVSKKVLGRKRAYMVFIVAVAIVLGFAIYFWNTPPIVQSAGIPGHIADILKYFSPKIFDGLIDFAVIKEPLWFYGGLVVAALFWAYRKYFLLDKLTLAKEKLREIVLSSVPDFQ